MLDTVALTILEDEFVIQEPGRFNPSAAILLSTPPNKLGGRGFMTCFQNPSKSDLLQGVYRPRLTLSKRVRQGGYMTALRIEFSAPKLIFGNNFDELETQDFSKVIDTLDKRLLEMGVIVRRESLRKAPVSAIHYSKNIPLDEFTTSSMLIRELSKINLNRRLDLSHTDYRNEGHSLRYHANSFELTFYDKIKDLEKAKFSEKRALESENEIQLDLFKNAPQRLEVLRMELRLGNRTKLKSILKKIGHSAELRFQDLFDQSISRRLLLHFWEQISESFSWIPSGRYKPEDLFQAVYEKGRIKPLKALQMVGGLLLIESVGIRGLRSLIDKNSNRTWQRLKKELENGPQLDGHKIMKEIQDSLIEFSTVKLDTHASLERINNVRTQGAI